MTETSVPELILGLFHEPKFIEPRFLDRHAEAIADHAATDGRLAVIELGAGDSRKASLLLQRLLQRSKRISYVPIDVSPWALSRLTADIGCRFPAVAVAPVEADFVASLSPTSGLDADRRLILLLGSSIGNFAPSAAKALLRKVSSALGPRDLALIGFDLVKDPGLLLPAYFDSQGITSSFNLNVLTRLQRALGAEVDIDAFRHHAFYDPRRRAMESYLISLRKQALRFPDHGIQIALRAHEGIHTESSFKYDPETLKAELNAAGLDPIAMFFDERRWFVDALVCPETERRGWDG
jgi:dimethylhistidine N-methyltransferase